MMLAAIRQGDPEIEVSTILSSLGGLRRNPTATFNLLAYEFRAAIDLGVTEHASNTLEALCLYVQDHPELWLGFRNIGQDPDGALLPKPYRTDG